MGILKDTPLGKPIDIPFGLGAKTVEVFELPDEVLTYSKGKGSGDCWYPLTVFCPKCSNTHEFSSKGNQWKEKWLIEEMDYTFSVQYAKDEDGEIFAECSKCGFDLRKEYIYGANEEKNDLPQEIEMGQISLLGVSYQDGCFVVPLENFKEAIKEGYTRKATMYAHVGSLSYKIGWAEYSNPDNIISKDRMIFLRKNLWKQA